MNTDKVYILQKDIDHPCFKIEKGIKMIKRGNSEDAAYVWEWFVLHPSDVENNPEWFKPEENKSNDSLQLIEKYEKECWPTLRLEDKEKELLNDFIHWQSHTPKPQAEKVYDKNLGDDKLCECGHPYYRHFDTYDKMSPVGCKYCQCDEFKEAKQQAENKPEWDWQLKDRVEFESADGYAEGYIEHIFWYKETAGIVFQDPHDLTKTLHDEVSFHKLKKLPPQPQKEEQRIGVTAVQRLDRDLRYWFGATSVIPYEKLPAIKEAIEQVLNYESVEELKHRIEYWQNNNQQNYDQWKKTNYELNALKKQVDSMCEDAFEAGRDRIGGWWNDQINNWKYASYRHYKSQNSKQKQ